MGSSPIISPRPENHHQKRKEEVRKYVAYPCVPNTDNPVY